MLLLLLWLLLPWLLLHAAAPVVATSVAVASTRMLSMNADTVADPSVAAAPVAVATAPMTDTTVTAPSVLAIFLWLLLPLLLLPWLLLPWLLLLWLRLLWLLLQWRLLLRCCSRCWYVLNVPKRSSSEESLHTGRPMPYLWTDHSNEAARRDVSDGSLLNTFTINQQPELSQKSSQLSSTCHCRWYGPPPFSNYHHDTTRNRACPASFLQLS
jgi:hypothetical protein